MIELLNYSWTRCSESRDHEDQFLVNINNELPEGIRSSHIDLSHPPERPPGGIFAKQRSGWALGQILCLAEKKHSIRGPCGPRIITRYLNC